jgi:hypothetical protein
MKIEFLKQKSSCPKSPFFTNVEFNDKTRLVPVWGTLLLLLLPLLPPPSPPPPPPQFHIS